jgi:hypothetical protein
MTMRAAVTIVCMVCEQPFETVHETRGRFPRFCSETCRWARKASQHRGYRAEGRFVLVRRQIEKLCEVCRASFSTTNLRTLCCGGRCGQVLALRNRTAAAVDGEPRAANGPKQLGMLLE